MLSLKAFHIIFIIASIIVSGGFGAWAINEYQVTQNISQLSMGIISILATLALMVYFVFVALKIKKGPTVENI